MSWCQSAILLQPGGKTMSSHKLQGGIVIVGELSNNGQPQVFNMGITCHTLDEGIQAAMDHYRKNYAHGSSPQFRTYKATDPDGSEHALVEVYDFRGDLVFTGLYKVIAGKFQWAT
jgi:hypothetical protein